MLCMNWKLALITFAVLPFIVVATKIFRDRVRDSYRRIRVAIARINSYLQEHVSGMVVLQLFNREQKATRPFSEINRNHMDAYKDAIMAYAVYYPLVEFLSAIAIACVIWFGGQDVMRQRSGVRPVQSEDLIRFTWCDVASLGVLIAFMQYAQRFFRPIMDFSEKYNILQSAMAASERIFKLLDTPVEIVSPAVTKKPARARDESSLITSGLRTGDAGREQGSAGKVEMARPDGQGRPSPHATMRFPHCGCGCPDWVSARCDASRSNRERPSPSSDTRARARRR